jgi:hypothetical protein
LFVADAAVLIIAADRWACLLLLLLLLCCVLLGRNLKAKNEVQLRQNTSKIGE